MKYSLPHNWQDDFLKKVDFTSVEEVYGKLPSDVIGGGRPSYASVSVSKKTFVKEVAKVRQAGLKFVYLLNSSCLDNQELSYFYRRKMLKFLKFLTGAGVDAVCIASPYLALFVRKHFPELKIHASVVAQIDSAAKALWWQENGAVKLTLAEGAVNRNFKLLKSIREAVSINIQLVANNCCIANCPLVTFHANGVSHASKKNDAAKGFFLDYYRLKCNSMRFLDKSLFLKADWIRPEDVSLYMDAGVDSLKIVNRSMDSGSIAKIVSAYRDKRYDGNLSDLLPSYAKDVNYTKIGLLKTLYYFFHPFKVNIFKLRKMKKAIQAADVYIDNRKLDGFLEKLIQKGCGAVCNNCSYCKEKADEVVEIKNFVDCSDIINEMEDGSFYRYFNFR